MKGFLAELGKKSERHSDSKSTVQLAKNSVFYVRTKHIRTKYHFIRGSLDEGELIPKKIVGSENLVGMLTNDVVFSKLELYCASVGLHS